MNTFVLAESTHAHIRSTQWEVAVLPFGACEPHNFHLPYGTDIFEADTVGRLACEFAYNKGAKVLLLPPIPFGVNTNLLDVPGALPLNVTPTTLLKILTDLVDALERKGIRKILLLNSHGGNELKPLIRELHHRTKVFLCVCDWFRIAKDQKIFDVPGDHADEMETSFALLHFPHLVDMKSAGPGTPRPTRFEATEKGWVQLSRPWHLLTEDTGVGDPRQASPEKAKKLLEIVTHRLGTFLYELAKSPMDDQFPFVK
jgi:creatinine amidohydrolase